MKTYRAKDIIRSLIAINCSIVFVLLLLSGAHAKPLKAQGVPFSFTGGKRGQAAITTLQDHLPQTASRYGVSAEKLRKYFLQDRDLWLDSAENLLYICSFDISEAATPPESTEPSIPVGPFPLDQTFKLHSLPGASKVIYLDFDGHITSGTIWNTNFNGGNDIVSLPYDFNGDPSSFSNTELGRIQRIWARVAEDFAIYQIDVTTEDPGLEALRKSNGSDTQYGARIVISPSSSWYGNAGGVAYIGSFAWNSDTPAFVFSDKLGSGNEKYVTDAASHETGHTLGLYHDGITGGTAYYAGHNGWAPIMGVGYYQPLTQWSKGEYGGANNTQDDLAVMLNYGITYRPDDHGDWIDNATTLSGDTFTAAGIIEKRDDTDVFSFQAGAGPVSITVDPANLDPNLDIVVRILDSGGNIIAEDDPTDILPASLNLNLPTGTYYILIDGVGTGDPDTGYTDYASLGQYFITGTLPTTQFPPAAPTGLSAAPASASQINLNWTDNSLNENGFTIERSTNGGVSWVQAGFAAADATTYTDTGLAANTTYQYRVAAYNVIGDSEYSNIASAMTFDLPPAAPSGLQAAPLATGQIQLAWTDNADNETGFAIERSLNGFTGWQEIAAVGLTTYVDSGLASGTTFYYRVSAYNQNGNSGYSNIASATTVEVAPSSPNNLTAAATAPDEITLRWRDNSNNETGFTIERLTDGPSSWTRIASVGANITTYSDTGVSPATTYSYRVFSFNTAGNSGYSNTAAATTDEPPQFLERLAFQEAALAGTVSNTFVETQANDSVSETITEETSGGRPNKRYSYLEHKWMFQIQPGAALTLFANVWASGLAAGDSLVFSYSTDDENYYDMFTVSTDYDDDSYFTYPLPETLLGTLYIRVTDTLTTPGIYDRGMLSVDHLFVRIDNNAGTPPAVPSYLTATGAGFDTIVLNWQDNADNELGFLIERSADGAGNWEEIGSAGPDTQTYTDTGLSPGTTFYYRVQAFNAAGVSGYTSIASTSTDDMAALHVAALDSLVEPIHKRWEFFVTVTVEDQGNNPVAGVTVAGLWDDGSGGNCITDTAGQCTVSTILKSSTANTSFSIMDLAKSGYIYDAAGNNADSIVVTIP